MLCQGVSYIFSEFFSKAPTPVLHSQWQAIICGYFLPLTIIIITDFLEKSIHFSKFFLKIFFRRNSSNYFFRKEKGEFLLPFFFYSKTSLGISSSAPKARASAIASPTLPLNLSFGLHWATPIFPSGRITVVIPVTRSRPTL